MRRSSSTATFASPWLVSGAAWSAWGSRPLHRCESSGRNCAPRPKRVGGQGPAGERFSSPGHRPVAECPPSAREQVPWSYQTATRGGVGELKSRPIEANEGLQPRPPRVEHRSFPEEAIHESNDD